jgi:hypothetical protein
VELDHILILITALNITIALLVILSQPYMIVKMELLLALLYVDVLSRLELAVSYRVEYDAKKLYLIIINIPCIITFQILTESFHPLNGMF